MPNQKKILIEISSIAKCFALIFPLIFFSLYVSEI